MLCRRADHATAALQQPPQQPAAGQQDALDKGVNTILDKAGHHQQGGTVEKISDGIRTAFKKATGKGECTRSWRRKAQY